MEFHRINTFLLLIVTNLLIVHATSSSDQHYDNFLKCLTDQFQRSNSSTNAIYTPQNPSYTSLLQSPNLRPASVSPRRPDVIVTPFYEFEIQASIFCSKKFGMQIRVRSGGHDFEGLSYTSPSGKPFVIIDMRNLRSITIADDQKTVRMQAGATLGELYHTISRKSKTLAVAAGVCPTVGVGGQFSGGGYGMMARKHSIAADHVVDARLINADGKILDRKSMGEDLFWAIRGGGGGSFGVVVEFTVSTVTVPETVTVFNVTRTLEENATELVHRWQYIADKVDDKLLLRIFLKSVRSPITGKRTIEAAFTTLYLGPIRDLLPLMEQKFPELGLVEQNCTEMSWIESILYFPGFSDQPLDILLDRNPQGNYAPIYHKGKSDYVSRPIPVSGLKGIWKFLNEEDEQGAELQFSPYGGAINDLSESDTPFPHRKGNIFMIEYGVGWGSAEESARHIDWSRRLHNYMRSYVTKSPRGAYVNYKDLDLGRNNIEGHTSYEQASAWGLRYFKGNFRRLVRVKTRVDPSNFFRNEQSIPALWKSQ
ncbi:hypothetical protein ACS0TY_018744 [Phlomoides rotata]